MERKLFVSVYVHARRSFTFCLPLGVEKGVNSLAIHQGKLSSTETLTDVDTLAVRIDLGTSDSIDDCASLCDSSVSIQVNLSYDSPHTSSSLSSTSDLSIDDLMNQAYGTTLINSDGGNRDNP